MEPPVDRHTKPYVSPDGAPVRCSFHQNRKGWPFVARCQDEATRNLSEKVKDWSHRFFDLTFRAVCYEHAIIICYAYEHDQVDEEVQPTIE